MSNLQFIHYEPNPPSRKRVRSLTESSESEESTAAADVVEIHDSEEEAAYRERKDAAADDDDSRSYDQIMEEDILPGLSESGAHVLHLALPSLPLDPDLCCSETKVRLPSEARSHPEIHQDLYIQNIETPKEKAV
jgi:hypothetical protein